MPINLMPMHNLFQRNVEICMLHCSLQNHKFYAYQLCRYFKAKSDKRIFISKIKNKYVKSTCNFSRRSCLYILAYLLFKKYQHLNGSLYRIS